MSDSVQPHRRQPMTLPRPWDSPGKNTGVGCHFLLQCMKVKSESEVAQTCPTLSDSMDYIQPTRPSVHGIFWARVLEWGAIAYFKFYLLVSKSYNQLRQNKKDFSKSQHNINAINSDNIKLVKVKVAQSCPVLCDPMDYIQSMEFSRPEYWSG